MCQNNDFDHEIVGVMSSLLFCICIPYLAQKCITMRRCVAYIPELYMTLNFTSKSKLKVLYYEFLSGARQSEFSIQVCGRWVYLGVAFVTCFQLEVHDMKCGGIAE